MGRKTLYRTKICPQCEIEFAPKDWRNTFCSRRCSKLKSPETKPCKQCGQPFTKQGQSNKSFGAQKFCSNRCKGAARVTTTHACANCGTEFVSKNGRIEASYCSRKCYWVTMRTELYPTRETRIGLEFSKPTRRALMEAAQGQCQQCSSTRMLQFDHIVPIHKGGTAEVANGQVLCKSCHNQKTASELSTHFKGRHLD